MLSSNDVREVRFVKSMSGYKQEEVDNFLDRVEEDFKSYEEFVKTAQAKIEQLTSELEASKSAQESIQNVLISAHQLADKIVNDANAKAEGIIGEATANAESITQQAKQLMADFDAKFTEKKAEAEARLSQEIAAAEKKREAVEIAAADAVKQQQAIFDRLKIEVAEFKAELTKKYKAHLEIIAQLPDDVVMDAQRAADAVSIEVEQTQPEVEEASVEDIFVEPETQTTPIMEIIAEAQEIDRAEETVGEIQDIWTTPQEVPVENNAGFTVNVSTVTEAEPIDIFSMGDDFEDDSSDDDDFGFSSSFFKRSKEK